MGQNLEVGKEQKKLVFKVITDLKKKSKSNSGAITLKDIRKKLEKDNISNEEIGAAIAKLDGEGHIHYDPKEEKLYV